MSKIPADVRAEIARRYVDEKQSMKRIGLDLFWSQGAVRNALVREGVDVRARGETPLPPRVPADEIRLVVELARDGGLCSEEIARQIGISSTAVRRRLAMGGVTSARPVKERCHLSRLHEIAQGGMDALTPRQRDVLRVVEQAGPAPLTTTQVAEPLGLLTRAVCDALHHLEGFGLVASRVTSDHHGRVREWRRTSVAMNHVLWEALHGAGRGPMLPLPVEPLREWLHRLLDREKRLRNVVSIATRKAEDSDGIGVQNIVADRLGVTERQLYAVLHERQTVTLDLADRMLTLANDGTLLGDLWPDLATDQQAAA